MNSGYIKCLGCKYIMRTEADAELCDYCREPLKDNSIGVTEREWREYWIGVFGQPFEYNKVRKTVQMIL